MSRDRSPSEPEQPEEELTVVEDWTRPDFETPESRRDKERQRALQAQESGEGSDEDLETGRHPAAPSEDPRTPPAPPASAPSRPPPLPSQRPRGEGSGVASIPKPPPMPASRGSGRPPATSSTTPGLGGSNYVPPTPGQPPAC